MKVTITEAEVAMTDVAAAYDVEAVSESGRIKRRVTLSSAALGKFTEGELLKFLKGFAASCLSEQARGEGQSV